MAEDRLAAIEARLDQLDRKRWLEILLMPLVIVLVTIAGSLWLQELQKAHTWQLAQAQIQSAEQLARAQIQKATVIT